MELLHHAGLSEDATSMSVLWAGVFFLISGVMLAVCTGIIVVFLCLKSNSCGIDGKGPLTDCVKKGMIVCERNIVMCL